MKICKIDKCFSEVYLKELCQKHYNRKRYLRDKPDGYIVYGLHEGDNKIKYVGMTETNLEKKKGHHRFHRNNKNIEILPIVSNIQNYDEAAELEEDYIKRYDTYKNGWNKTPDGKGGSIYQDNG